MSFKTWLQYNIKQLAGIGMLEKAYEAMQLEVSRQKNDINLMYKRIESLEDACRQNSECISKIVADISDKISATEHMQSQLSVLSKEISRLSSVLLSGRSVSQVVYPTMKLFMYDNDLITDISDDERRRHIGKADAYYHFMNGCNVIQLLFDHYWRHELDFTFLDIGCQYGHESILAGEYIKKRGYGNQIHCFDSGQAGMLMPFNIMLNELEHCITFHRIAISNTSKPLIMYYEPGYSEHNRFVNPDSSASGSTTLSYPIESTTLDDFCLQNNINNYVVAKMDTEGSEPFILEGMRKIIEAHPMTFITEYNPYNFAENYGIDHLNYLLNGNYLIDIGELQGAERGCEREAFVIPEARLAEYVEYIKRKDSVWADILVLPHTLPFVEELLSLVSGECPF